MSACPNCRHPDYNANVPCPQCRWLPLQATELVFLDEDDDAFDALQPKSASNYHLSALFALTAVIAVCLAISRASLIVGIPLSLLSAAGVFRTALLLAERKSHGYPVRFEFLITTFFNTAVAVFAGAIAFVVITWLGGTLIAFIVLSPFAGPTFTTLAIMSVLAAALSGVGYAFYHHHNLLDTLRPSLAGGAAVGFVHAALFLISSPYFVGNVIDDWLMFWIMLIYLPVLILIAIHQTVRRRCGHHATAFVLGAASTCWAPGLIVYSWLGPNSVHIPLIFPIISLLWFPFACLVYFLQKIWSWDDAFPTVTTRSSADFPTRSTSVVPANDDDIAFL